VEGGWDDRPGGEGWVARVVESRRPGGIGWVRGEGVAAVEQGRRFCIGLAVDGEDLGVQCWIVGLWFFREGRG
jgi:hypothetical protein